MEPSRDWMSIILSAITGAFTAVVAMVAWFGRTLASYDQRIANLELAHSAQVEQHRANLRNMERIEDELVNLDSKQDKHTATILEALGKRVR